jgi:hypothetical protein
MVDGQWSMGNGRWSMGTVDVATATYYYLRGAGEDSAVNGRPHRCGLFF